MSELKKVWVTDTRHPNKPAFLYAEHLLKFSKHLKRASKPKPKPKGRQQARVTEPAPAPSPANTRSTTENKK